MLVKIQDSINHYITAQKDSDLMLLIKTNFSQWMCGKKNQFMNLKIILDFDKCCNKFFVVILSKRWKQNVDSEVQMTN